MALTSHVSLKMAALSLLHSTSSNSALPGHCQWRRTTVPTRRHSKLSHAVASRQQPASAPHGGRARRRLGQPEEHGHGTGTAQHQEAGQRMLSATSRSMCMCKLHVHVPVHVSSAVMLWVIFHEEYAFLTPIHRIKVCCIAAATITGCMQQNINQGCNAAVLLVCIQ